MAHRDQQQYVGILEAARRYGTSVNNLRRRIESGALQSFSDPLDHRRRLLLVADLERFVAPRPVDAPATTDARERVASPAS